MYICLYVSKCLNLIGSLGIAGVTHIKTKIVVDLYTIYSSPKCDRLGRPPNSNIWAGKKQSCPEVWLNLPRKKYTLLIYFRFWSYLCRKCHVKHPKEQRELQTNTPTAEMVRFHCVNSNDGSTATNTGRSVQSKCSMNEEFPCGNDFGAILRVTSTKWDWSLAACLIFRSCVCVFSVQSWELEWAKAIFCFTVSVLTSTGFGS